MGRYVLAVDGGNSKTVAVIVDEAGSVVAFARGGCADIYGAGSPDAAIVEIVATARAALKLAALTPSRLTIAAFGLAGADWPEDYALLESRLASAIPTHRPPLVVNDAVGSLWAGSADGRGAAAACGTFGAVAASGPRGLWHSSFWVEPAGAVPLSEAALRAVCRAELATGPETRLRETLLSVGGFDSVDALLHHFTSRARPPRASIARFAPAILDVAEDGDPIAQSLIVDLAGALARSIQAGVTRTALSGSYPLILAGGLLRHHSTLLRDTVAEALPQARPVVVTVEPVAGVAVMAARQAGLPDARGATLAALSAQPPRPTRHHVHTTTTAAVIR